MRVAVLAVDGGNSKTDVALVAGDGRLLATVRGPTVSHQQVGVADGLDTLQRLTEQASRAAGVQPVSPVAEIGVYCLAGADFPSDVRLLQRGLATRGLSLVDVVLNDCFAALRAGANAGWGVVLICGKGINGAGVGPNGRAVRFAGIGGLSGDRGGADWIGTEGLGSAVRALDGRGRQTSLEAAVPAHFGLPSPGSVLRAFYSDRLVHARIAELSPVVFTEAMRGDPVARDIVDRLADELITMAVALMRRLRVVRREVEVVLAGGVFATEDHAFHERVSMGVRKVAPRARTVRLTTPPVLGAALLGLDRLAPGGVAAAEAERRLRDEIALWSKDLGEQRPES